MLLIGTLRTNFSEILIKINNFSCKKNAFENVICNMASVFFQHWCINTLRPRQNGRHFADDIFECIFLNENVWMSIKISLKFVHQDPINNIPELVQIMASRLPGDKPLSGPMLVRLPTHICVTRPQWVKSLCHLTAFRAICDGAANLYLVEFWRWQLMLFLNHMSHEMIWKCQILYIASLCLCAIYEDMVLIYKHTEFLSQGLGM